MNSRVFMSIFVCAAIITLSGCASFSPRPLEPSQKASEFESRTLDSRELKRFLEENLKHEIKEWPVKKWDLDELTFAAVYFSPDMDVARARWGVAEAGIKSAGARPNPSVGYTTQYDAHSPAGLTPWTLGISFDIPIEVAGKRGYRISKAERLSNAARINIANAAWKVSSRLRSRLLSLYGARESESILQRKAAILEEMVKALEKRLKAGEVPQPDVTGARISLEEARSSLFKARGDRIESMALVADALGLPASAVEGVEFVFPFTDASVELPSSEIRRQALLNRTDVLASLEEYRASEAALQLEVAKQYPDIHLGPGYTWDQGIDKWALGFSIELPVLNRNEGPIAEAEARRVEAEADFNALQARIIGDIGRAVSGYGASVEKLEAEDKRLSEGRRRLKETEALFSSGEEDSLFLLGARLEIEAMNLSRLAALVDAQRFLGLLEDAVERPLKGSLFSIERYNSKSAGGRR